jgi:hypothetical protein
MTELAPTKRLIIRPGYLLSVYVIIPISVLIVSYDMLASGILKSYLQSSPDKLRLFTLIFTLPHILSSFFGFFEKEYINVYGKKLLRGAQLVSLGSIFISAVSQNLALFAFSMLTMYHVARQQSGVAKMLGKIPAQSAYRVWDGIGVLFAFVIYLRVYIATNLTWIGPLLVILLICFLFASVALIPKISGNIGKAYFLSTVLLPVVSLGVYYAGYPLLTILIPRVVHDLTAYAYYVSHDQNRFAYSGENYIYKFSSRLGLPPIIANPMLSIALALGFQGFYKYGAGIFLMWIFLLHYYCESFIWKASGLHRKYIFVS